MTTPPESAVTAPVHSASAAGGGGPTQAADRVRLPIGVFDSGVGGLTVLRALRAALPGEDFIYLGDTARLPYGTKSSDTVRRYALQASGLLVRRGVKALVIACNTASAVALDAIAAAWPEIPVEGVIDAGAQAACEATQTGHVLVAGTERTIAERAYHRAIRARRPDVTVAGRPCPMFVALAEEGWVEGEVVEAVARRYLEGDLRDQESVDTIVLGCTHFPVLAAALARVCGPDVKLVDSASTTAARVVARLSGAGLLRGARGASAILPAAVSPDVPARGDAGAGGSRGAGGSPGAGGSDASERTARSTAQTAPVAPEARGASVPRGRLRLLSTDEGDRFARVGAVFLGETIAAGDVELVDL